MNQLGSNLRAQLGGLTQMKEFMVQIKLDYFLFETQVK